MTAHQIVAEAKAIIREIGADEAVAWIMNGANLIDVREPHEYAAGHIPGAVNVPRGLLEFTVGTVTELMDKSEPVVVYCKTSGRSALATAVLLRMGFMRAVCLAGGFDQWSAERRPTDRPQPLEFD